MCGAAQILKALHRRTLRNAVLRRQGKGGFVSSAGNFPSNSHLPQRQEGWDSCPDDVEVHSFEVWAPVSVLKNLKFLPLSRRLNDAETEPTEESSAAPEVDASVPQARPVKGESSRTRDGETKNRTLLDGLPSIGEASATYRDFCLVAGEIGVSVGRVYTSLTGFTDADSAGTLQLTATRLLLCKAGKCCISENCILALYNAVHHPLTQEHFVALRVLLILVTIELLASELAPLVSGYELLDLGMNMPYKESIGAKPLSRDMFMKLFRLLRDQQALPLDATIEQCCDEAQATAESADQPCGGRPAGAQVMLDDREDLTTRALPRGFMGCRKLFEMLGRTHVASPTKKRN